MEKLKTLKETPCDSHDCRERNNCGSQSKGVNAEQLKQEAIKWVKELKEMNLGTWSLFIEFFNITEEDLK